MIVDLTDLQKKLNQLSRENHMEYLTIRLERAEDGTAALYAGRGNRVPALLTTGTLDHVRGATYDRVSEWFCAAMEIRPEGDPLDAPVDTPDHL